MQNKTNLSNSKLYLLESKLINTQTTFERHILIIKLNQNQGECNTYLNKHSFVFPNALSMLINDNY